MANADPNPNRLAALIEQGRKTSRPLNRATIEDNTRYKGSKNTPAPHSRSGQTMRGNGAPLPPIVRDQPSVRLKAQARSRAIQQMKGNGVNPNELAPVQQRRGGGNSGKKPF